MDVICNFGRFAGLITIFAPSATTSARGAASLAVPPAMASCHACVCISQTSVHRPLRRRSIHSTICSSGHINKPITASLPHPHPSIAHGVHPPSVRKPHPRTSLPAPLWVPLSRGIALRSSRAPDNPSSSTAFRDPSETLLASLSNQTSLFCLPSATVKLF